jgi:hypothetical protein
VPPVAVTDTAVGGLSGTSLGADEVVEGGEEKTGRMLRDSQVKKRAASFSAPRKSSRPKKPRQTHPQYLFILQQEP